MFAETGFSNFYTFKITEENAAMLNVDYLKAIRDARSARFEHGENGGFPKD